MKIHERLKSKAVDIHIQKMASLTLNGAPLRAATNQYHESEKAERERERARARRAKPHEHCRVCARLGSARRGGIARHCSLACDDERSTALVRHFVSFGKGAIQRPIADRAFTLSHTRDFTPRCVGNRI